jgi:hypothetical protein
MPKALQSNVSYIPIPFERKSGIPQETDIPASSN